MGKKPWKEKTLKRSLEREKIKMALKTFNVDAQIYKEFSEYCKKNGISMSKKVENFFKDELMKIKLGANGNIEANGMAKTGDIKEFKITKHELFLENHPLKKYC